MRTVLRLSARSRLVVVLATASFCLGAGGLSRCVDTRPAAVRAADWATAHVNQLPAKLDDFMTLPLEYRRAAFREASPEVRSALWQEQLGRVLADEALAPQEREILQKAQRLLTPDVFSGKGDLAAAKQVCVDLHNVASTDEVARLTTLGGLAAPEADGPLVRVARAIQSLFALRAQDECDCAVSTICPNCNAPDYCVQMEVSGCVWHAYGQAGDYCGCFGLWPCDGECGIVI
jgi:hypothetical protein